jgi:DNA polymerase I-like protein with 3'-5' exonuclease and polymerase domains
LLTIKKMQEVLIAEKGLEVSIELDNRFVKVLAYIEYCGIKLDVEKWKKKIESTRKELGRYKDLLDVFIIEQNMSDFINYQQDLFSPGLTTLINWNSPKQVVKFFNNIGVNTKVKNKGKESDTVEQGHLMKFVKEYPIIETYCKYKECQKDLGTYGENWFKLINPVTGRVHTSYKQLMNTGRLSSGGKDKVMKVDLPNMQNIPSDEETRSCFVSEKGHMMISCDYSSQESVVLTNQSLEPNLLEFYDKGFSDMHSFVAKKMFKELNHLELDEIKKNHKNRRQQSKIVSFCLAYGGSAQALADQLNLTKDEAEDIYNKYFEAFSQLKDYFETGKKEALEKGYVTLSKITGKKCYIDYFEEFKELEKTFDKAYWTRYRNLKEKAKDSPSFLEMREKVSKYFSKKGDIERISQNYCVQGESSEITKLAGIYFWQDYIIPNNLFGIVKLVNVVHDEWVIEAPNNMIDEVTNEIVLAMEKGALPFCKRVKLKAEAAVDTFWKK